MEEIWVDVINYEWRYMVSNFGVIKSKPRIKIRKNGRPLTVKGKTLSYSINKDGYLMVELHEADGSNTPKFVHKVVWESFNGKVPDGLEIGHHDCNPQNARLDNLYLCTHPYNCNHPITRERRSKAMIGNTISKGLVSKFRKSVICTDIDGNLVKEYASITECKKDGFYPGNICLCCNNKYLRDCNNIYKGYKWFYKPL